MDLRKERQPPARCSQDEGRSIGQEDDRINVYDAGANYNEPCGVVMKP